MNFGQMKTELRLTLGNLQSGDPFYDYADEWLNRSLNRIITLAIGMNRNNLNLFPTLATTWVDVTVDGANYLAMPEDRLAIQAVHSFDKTSSDSDVDKTVPLTYKDFEVFSVLSKDSTRVGFPRIWSMHGKRIYLHPTPESTPTSYLTDVRLFGVMKEVEMTLDADEPFIEEQWHDVVVTYAAYLGFKAMGLHEEAAPFRKAAMDEIALNTDITGLSLMGTTDAVTLEDGLLSSRAEIYGG